MALLSKKSNEFHGMGAAVVIIGALFKITHIEFELHWKFNVDNWLKP
jgi:hypothetical protein